MGAIAGMLLGGGKKSAPAPVAPAPTPASAYGTPEALEDARRRRAAAAATSTILQPAVNEKLG